MTRRPLRPKRYPVMRPRKTIWDGGQPDTPQPPTDFGFAIVAKETPK